MSRHSRIEGNERTAELAKKLSSISYISLELVVGVSKNTVKTYVREKNKEHSSNTTRQTQRKTFIKESSKED